MRYVVAGASAAIILGMITVGAVLLTHDGDEPGVPVSTLVSGRTLVDGRPPGVSGAVIDIYQSALPLAEFVDQGGF